MDHQDLREMFELYGTVLSAKVVMDFNTRKSKGFGFVEMERAADAKDVMELLNGRMMAGRQLVVKEAERSSDEDTGLKNDRCGAGTILHFSLLL